MNERQNSEQVTQALISQPRIEGLPALKCFIERVGFGKLQVQQLVGPYNDIGLVLHLDSPLSLNQLLEYYNGEDSTWGQPHRDSKHVFLELTQHLDLMSLSNGKDTDIEELTVSFSDCQLVLQKSHSRSVSDIWQNTFSLLRKHYDNLSHEILGFPSEIFPSVYGMNEDSDQVENLPDAGFWSLYYECDDRAWIYDLKSRTLQVEEVQFLNTSK
ncbi:hypothetical protein SAMN04490243_1690 [Robiginitalea myxolifaciens]|uniref:Uncharacterized protein n=1 Tax=Robiginitalea myxolifaciens TaxID=400055 RepID=A0A1I6GSY7_9FLAO|nr:hypothetical protein [Robiginitalea myxolifaciens]SFR45332.1 hypothetical protein SAMN04490243_1690 [Robiginitalea myxolifaciens]